MNKRRRNPLSQSVVIACELLFFPAAILMLGAFTSNDSSGLQFLNLYLAAGWAGVVLCSLLISAFTVQVPARLLFLGFAFVAPAATPEVTRWAYLVVGEAQGVILSIVLMLLTLRGATVAVWRRIQG